MTTATPLLHGPAPLPATEPWPDPASGALASGQPRRVRFAAVRVTHAAGGTGRVHVELESVEGATVVGSADIEPSETGELRAAAGATVDALRSAIASAHRFTLVGVKSVRAFDETVVLVQLARTAGDGPARLVGAAVADGGLLRAAVLAVLSATNRVLSGPGRA